MTTKVTDKGLIEEGTASGLNVQVPTTIAGATTISGAVTVTGAMTVNGGMVSTVAAKTAALTALTAGGVYTLSGTTPGWIAGVSLPAASGQAGAKYTLRNLNAAANYVTAAADTAGTTPITDGTDHGSKMALEAAVGSSVTFMSDGLNWLVTASSGTLTINGA